MAFNKAKVLDEIQRYIQKGQLDKAIEEYEKVLRLDPKDYKLRQKLGDLYLRKGRKSESIAQYMQVADSYVKDGFYLKAIALYRQILRSEPTKIDIYDKLADLYSKQGLLADAVTQLRTLAEYYEKQKKLSEAMQAWEKIISVDSDNIIYRGKLIEFYLKQGLTTRAAEKLKQSIDYFKSKGRYDDVENLAAHFPGILEEDKTVGIQLARSLVGLAKYQEALEKLEPVVKANPKDAEAFCLIGLCHLNLGKNDLAKRSIETSLKISPDSLDAKKAMLKVLAKDNNWVSLIMLLEEVVSQLLKNKSYEDAKTLLDKYSAQLSEEKKIIRMYADLLRATGDMPGLIEKLKRLGAMYVKEGNELDSTKYFKEILAIDPYEPSATAFFEERKPKQEEMSSQGEEISFVEEIEFPEEKLADVSKEIEEVGYLLKYGLLSKAKSKLEDLSVKFQDSPLVKEKWLDYFEITKDIEAHLMVLQELVSMYSDLGNTEKLVFYGEKLNALKEKQKIHIDTDKSTSGVSDEDLQAVQDIQEFEEIEELEETKEIQDIEEIEEIKEISEEVSTKIIPGISQNIDDMLIEADFYLSNNLQDEAIRLYKTVLGIDPENTTAREALDTIASGTMPKEQLIVVQEKEKEEFFDLSAEIMEELEEETRKMEALPEGKSAFDELLDEFNVKHPQEIDEAELETHYNLGIAYKEMGLFDDSIQEFVLTSRFASKAYDSFTMLAICLTEKGEYAKAVEFFKKALNMPDTTKEKQAGIYFEIGTLYEKLGDPQKAVYCFKKAIATDTKLTIAQEKILEMTSLDPSLSGISEKDVIAI